TTRKTRVVADQSHQVLRIDHEVAHPIGTDVEMKLCESIKGALESASVLVLSDYLKGAITETVVKRSISMAQQANVPV
ncbi:hypothetical protein ABTD04_20895, partial [Acinetobacter baumannii]